MKKLIFLLLLVPIVGLAQEGGYRSLKTKSAKVTFTDLTGTENRLLIVKPNGDVSATPMNLTQNVASTTVLGSIKIDGTTLVMGEDSVLSVSTAGSGWNHTYQSLSGTTVTYNASNGINANITLSGNTTINMSNVQAGMVGNITIINDGTARQLTFTGYTFKISLKIRGGTNMAWSSATGFDKFSWDYDGTRLTITGEYNME